MPFNWTCPHCSVPQTVVADKQDSNWRSISLGEQSEGKLVIKDEAVGCSNPECRKTTIHVKIAEGGYANQAYYFKKEGEIFFEQFVYPQGLAKPQPDFIPKPLVEDYYEACLIRDLSPKASATLTRRCLQGLIRDFAGIKKGTLAAEINALREAVASGDADRSISQESVEAIDHVRGIGNIGAHMEKDIDLIVEVDPGEAQALIELTEMLFDEWYGARERRATRLKRVALIADEKKKKLAQAKAAKGTDEAESDLPQGLANALTSTLVTGGPLGDNNKG